MTKQLTQNALSLALFGASLAGGAAAQDAVLASPALNQAPFAATTLKLTAVGEIKAAPDMATIRLGVMTSAQTAKEALAQNAVKSAKVLAALKQFGVAGPDLQTPSVTVNAQYAYDPKQPPRLTGYQADEEIAGVQPDLSGLGATLDAAVAAGATQIDSVALGFADPIHLEDEARKAAIQRLRAEADLYAKFSGYRVVRLVSLAEGNNAPPASPLLRYSANAVPQATTKVEIGQIEVKIILTGLYELGPS